jgi:hypothetical protein
MNEEQTQYTGHTYCRKCGTSHWMYGSCPEKNKNMNEEPKIELPLCEKGCTWEDLLGK